MKPSEKKQFLREKSKEQLDAYREERKRNEREMFAGKEANPFLLPRQRNQKDPNGTMPLSFIFSIESKKSNICGRKINRFIRTAEENFPKGLWTQLANIPTTHARDPTKNSGSHGRGTNISSYFVQRRRTGENRSWPRRKPSAKLERLLRGRQTRVQRCAQIFRP